MPHDPALTAEVRAWLSKAAKLVELGEACSRIDRSLESLFRRAAPLTEYAWTFRYPGDPDEPSAQEAADALAVARAVFEAVSSRLPSDAHP